MFPSFNNESIFSSKTIKIGATGCIFETKQNDICYYKHWCFMYGGLMLYNIIVNLVMETQKMGIK